MDADKRRAFALQLLNNPLLGDILTGMKASIVNQWRSSKTPESRDVLWHDYTAIERLENAIESTLRKADEALGVENEYEDDSL